MLRIVLSIILAALSCTAFAQKDIRTAALDGVPGLDKPITLSLRAASIREVLDKVEADTGVRLRPDRAIAEDKATIWVKDKPARDVLRALARCFNLCWTESEVGSLRYLHLSMDRDSQSELRRRHYEDYLAIVKQFDTELEAAAQFIRAGQTYQAPQYDPTRFPNRDEYERLTRRRWLTQVPPFAAMVLQCLKLSESQKKSLLDGNVVQVSTEAIAQEAKEKYPEATSFSCWVERSLGGYLLQVSLQPAMQPWDWLLLAVAIFDDSRYDKTVQKANQDLLKDQALARELPSPKPKEQASTPTPKPDEKTAAPTPAQVSSAQGAPAPGYRPDEILPNVPRPGEGSGATPTTMSDGLVPIAKAAELPVVAQYLSEYAGASNTGTQGKIGERLAQLCTQHRFTIERDSDFLLAKSLLWHRLSAREVPEEKIRRWQRAFGGLPAPTFDAAVEMGSLSWDQIRGIINNSPFWFGSLDLAVLAPSEYALKLYASLTAAQKRALSQGAEIPVSALKPAQQHLFIQAFEGRARPSYAKAQDPAWPGTAGLSLADARLAGSRLTAAADMKALGSEDLMEYVPQEQKTHVGSTGDSSSTSYTLTRPPDEYIPKAAKALADRVAAEHPEIPPKQIAVYATRRTAFRLRIGEETDETRLTYSVKVR